MEEACCKDCFGAFNVLSIVDQKGECTVEVEELLHECVAGSLLAEEGESAGDGYANADHVLEALGGEPVDFAEREAVSSSGLLELLGGNFAGLEDAKDLLGRLLDCWVESCHPMVDVRRCPSFRDVVLEGWLWWLQDVCQYWRFVCWWIGWR